MRQSFGAAGASLLAPIAVLVAAGVLVGSGGLGGLSGLGQITSGPSLPGSDLAAGATGNEQADIVGAEVVTPTAVGRAPSATGLTSAPGIGGGFMGDSDSRQVPSPLLDVPTAPGGRGGGGTTPSPLQAPSGTTPGPVEQVVGGTREGLQTTLPEPIKPVTEDILNLLLGPPR